MACRPARCAPAMSPRGSSPTYHVCAGGVPSRSSEQFEGSGVRLTLADLAAHQYGTVNPARSALRSLQRIPAVGQHGDPDRALAQRPRSSASRWEAGRRTRRPSREPSRETNRRWPGVGRSRACATNDSTASVERHLRRNADGAAGHRWHRSPRPACRARGRPRLRRAPSRCRNATRSSRLSIASVWSRSKPIPRTASMPARSTLR